MSSTHDCRDVLAAFAKLIWEIQWTNVALIVIIIYGAWLLYRIHTAPDNNFSLVDLFMTDGQGDIGKLAFAAFAILSVWVIEKMVDKEKFTEVVTLLPIVLGIFVARNVLNRIFGKDNESNKP